VAKILVKFTADRFGAITMMWDMPTFWCHFPLVLLRISCLTVHGKFPTFGFKEEPKMTPYNARKRKFILKD